MNEGSEYENDAPGVFCVLCVLCAALVLVEGLPCEIDCVGCLVTSWRAAWLASCPTNGESVAAPAALPATEDANVATGSPPLTAASAVLPAVLTTLDVESKPPVLLSVEEYPPIAPPAPPTDPEPEPPARVYERRSDHAEV